MDRREYICNQMHKQHDLLRKDSWTDADKLEYMELNIAPYSSYWRMGMKKALKHAIRLLREEEEKADRKTESSSEKPNNCECETRKEQNFCGKCRYLYRDFKYGLSCYRLMDNEPCKYEARKTEDSSMVDKDINVRSKTEPQTERGGRDEYKVL